MAEPADNRASTASPRFPWIPFLLGAVLGGLMAAAIGGVVGALIGWAGAWLLRRRWPRPARWLAAIAVWSIGFLALLFASGFVATVQGLLQGRR